MATCDLSVIQSYGNNMLKSMSNFFQGNTGSVRLIGRKGEIKEGTFENGKLHGQGLIILEDGSIAEGKFIDGWLQTGKINYPNSCLLEGSFKDGKLNGLGQITRSTGAIEKGEFKDNILNGIGSVILNLNIKLLA